MKLPNTSKQYAATCPIPHSVACQKHPPPHRPLLKYWSLTPWMARMNCQGIRLGDRGHSQNHAGSYWTCVDDHSFVWCFSHGLVHSKEAGAISTNRCKPTKQFLRMHGNINTCHRAVRSLQSDPSVSINMSC